MGAHEAPPEVSAVARWSWRAAWRNEWEAGNSDNIVHVLARQENCPWPEAAHHAEQIIAEATDHFLQAESASSMRPQVKALCFKWDRSGCVVGARTHRMRESRS